MPTRKQLIEEMLESFHVIGRNFLEGHVPSHGCGDITFSQGFILSMVAKHGSMNVKDLASTLRITSGAVTQMVSSLAEKGYLVRRSNPSDRRSSDISLSAMAKKHWAAIRERKLSVAELLLKALSKEEITAYISINRKISAAIRHQ